MKPAAPEQNPGREFNRLEKARILREHSDTKSRKFKVFLALKPILFQQYKRDLIDKCLRSKKQKKAIRSLIAIIHVRRILLKSWRDLNTAIELNKCKNRQVWNALLIMIHFRRVMKKFGKTQRERLQKTVRWSIVLRSVSQYDATVEKSKVMLHHALKSNQQKR